MVGVVRQQPCPTTAIHLQVKTLLRRVQDFAGFIIKSVRLTGEAKAPVIEVQLDADSRFKRRCSCCGGPGRVHDILPERRWDFVPLWGIAVALIYAMRRIDCRRCGVKVELVPWATGKSPTTIAMEVFLARWAKRLSWKQVSEIFWVSWDRVYRSV